MKEKGIWNEYKGAIRIDIQKYCKEQGISSEQFHFVSMYEWENIYDKILFHFADWIRNKNKNLHWLNINGGIAKDVEACYSFYSYKQEDWILKLPSIVNERRMYLLLEESRQRSKFWIAEGDVETVAQIIWEGFYGQDYYIVDKKYQWMITRNHHEGVIFIAKKELSGSCFNPVLYEIPRDVY